MSTKEKIVKMLITLYRVTTFPADFGVKDVCPYYMSTFWKLITLLFVLDTVMRFADWRTWGWCEKYTGVDVSLDEMVEVRGEKDMMDDEGKIYDEMGDVNLNVNQESWRILKGNYQVGEWVGVLDDL
ncbi:hypothetical protein IFR05_013594 [Cadophora sp. M221]|nr:hypothetical protein IFR05_013594 [Cadophora sp. M221]